MRIEEIQGDGLTSPIVNQQATTCPAFVTAVSFEGFWIQHSDHPCDAISSGLFVYTGPDSPSPSEGQYVSVTGTVLEYNDAHTQLSNNPTWQLETVPSGIAFPEHVMVQLPAASAATLEALEGMLVDIVPSNPTSDMVVVSEVFQLGRFGEFVACVADRNQGRVFQYTQLNSPDSLGYQTFEASLDTSCVTVDDNFGTQNPDPPLAGNVFAVKNPDSFRAGSELTTLRGPLYQRTVSDYYKVFTFDSQDLVVVDVNPRTGSPTPSLSAGDVNITSTNLLNFFTSVGKRGADNEFEFDRQLEKLLTALSALNTDVIGMVELENDNGNDAARILRDELNVKLPNRDYESASFLLTEDHWFGSDSLRRIF